MFFLKKLFFFPLVSKNSIIFVVILQKWGRGGIKIKFLPPSARGLGELLFFVFVFFENLVELSIDTHQRCGFWYSTQIHLFLFFFFLRNIVLSSPSPSPIFANVAASVQGGFFAFSEPFFLG